MGTQSVSANSAAVRQSLPYPEPVLKPNVAAQATRAQARSTQYYKTSIVQRVLVQVTDWVKSRVATFRIGSALAPFVRSASRQDKVTATAAQLDALNNALASAESVKNGADAVLNTAVSRALAKLDRKEKAVLREYLVDETGLSERVRDGLLIAVTASRQESISADADFYVLASLDSIATMIQVPFLIKNNEDQASRNFTAHLKFAPASVVKHLVSQAGPYFYAHLQLMSQVHGAVDQASLLSPERQIACLSSTTKNKVQSWFRAQPQELQNKVAAAINASVADKDLQAANEPASKRTRAFCIWLQQALVPGHAS